MWSDRKPWWQRKATDNQTDPSHRKTWCVIKLTGFLRQDINGRVIGVDPARYVAVGKSNAPQYYDPTTGKLKKAIEVNNLTKQEAIACAKGLNFLDGETNGN